MIIINTAIIKNRIISSINCGIGITRSHNTEIKGNTISGGKTYGISIGESSENIIIQNDIIENSESVHISNSIDVI